MEREDKAGFLRLWDCYLCGNPLIEDDPQTDGAHDACLLRDPKEPWYEWEDER